jgi:DeoR family transcriptional regulator of aga operon
MKAPKRKTKERSSMLIEERRQHVLGRIAAEGRVLVSDLSDTLGISRITIRKDLEYLEKQGLLLRTHGGALAPRSGAFFDPSIKEKEQQQLREKQLIAAAASSLVQEGQCVLLDSGTTTTAVARALRAFSHLTVVTNAANIAIELAGTNFEVILIGGALRKNSLSLVGPQAEDMLREIHADILFLGVDGLDSKIGITTPNVQEARVNRLMLQASQKVVAVCDSTKFKRRSVAIIAPMSEIDTIITDSQIPKDEEDALRSQGIEVIIA